MYRGFFDNGKKRKNSSGKTLAMSNSANTKDANRPRARPHHVAVSRFRIEHGPPLAAGDKEQKKTTKLFACDRGALEGEILFEMSGELYKG